MKKKATLDHCLILFVFPVRARRARPGRRGGQHADRPTRPPCPITTDRAPRRSAPPSPLPWPMFPASPPSTHRPTARSPMSTTLTPLTLDYTITAGGNGPDTYTITGSIASQANNLSDAGVSFSASGGPGETITITGSGASIDLGATITTTGSTTSVLHVPADGVDTDGAVNGIAVDDIVVVNGGTPTRVTAHQRSGQRNSHHHPCRYALHSAGCRCNNSRARVFCPHGNLRNH